MSVVVTGCAGFIGSHYVEYLLKNDYNVIGYDNYDDFYPKTIKYKNISGFKENKNFNFFNEDFSNISFEKINDHNDIEAIVHLAANAGVRPSMENPMRYIKNNVLNTVKLLEACRKFDIHNIIFASSSSVYGNLKKSLYSEDLNLNRPISNYAASKLSNELFNYVYSDQYGFNITNLRFFTVYGPRQRPEMAIHKFFKNITENEIINIYGNGDSSRDYTYISDIIDGINLALEKFDGYQTFNLGNSNTITLMELIHKIEKIVGKKAKITLNEKQIGDVDHTIADLRKAKEILGYSPKVKIDEGLNRFYDWYLNKF